MNFHVPCHFCSKSLYKSCFQEQCGFPHKLEQCMKVVAQSYVENYSVSIKTLRNSIAANKYNVFPLYCMRVH